MRLGELGVGGLGGRELAEQLLQRLARQVGAHGVFEDFARAMRRAR